MPAGVAGNKRAGGGDGALRSPSASLLRKSGGMHYLTHSCLLSPRSCERRGPDPVTWCLWQEWCCDCKIRHRQTGDPRARLMSRTCLSCSKPGSRIACATAPPAPPSGGGIPPTVPWYDGCNTCGVSNGAIMCAHRWHASLKTHHTARRTHLAKPVHPRRAAPAARPTPPAPTAPRALCAAGQVRSAVELHAQISVASLHA